MSAVTTAVTGLGAAAPASAEATQRAVPCPARQALGNYLTDDNVTSSFSNSGSVSSYRFTSKTSENPANGVPGLISYCVYPTPSGSPSTITVQASGANGARWLGVKDRVGFAFTRPDGNPSNIPLDAKNVPMGTATWTSIAPSVQQILLHINDPKACAALYGEGAGGTCFVKPSAPCTSGGKAPGTVYTAIPTDILQCGRVPSLGYDYSGTSEFGDEVGPNPTGGTLQALRVLFLSYGCSVSGHWNTGDCVTTPGATFTHPITANIYAVDNSGPVPRPGALLATVTTTQTIRYRPSADPACTGADAGKYFDVTSGQCLFAIPQLLTFTFPAGATVPTQVIWTIAFNTTHYGSPPIGQGAACYSTAPGCPYDNLNVGVFSFPGAPYVGTDIDPNGVFLKSALPSFYCDGGIGGTGFLRSDTPCWTGYRPLGEILAS